MPDEPDTRGSKELAPEVDVHEPEEALPPIGPVALFIRRMCLIAVLPAFSAFYLWQALTIELPNRTLLVSPRGFPTLVGVLMVVVTVAIAAIEIHKIRRAAKARDEREEASAETDDDQERITSWRDAWVTFGALVAYVLLFGELGFLATTIVFLAALSTYLTPRSWLRNVIVSVVFTVAVDFVFTELLHVQLPNGVFLGIF